MMSQKRFAEKRDNRGTSQSCLEWCSDSEGKEQMTAQM